MKEFLSKANTVIRSAALTACAVLGAGVLFYLLITVRGTSQTSAHLVASGAHLESVTKDVDELVTPELLARYNEGVGEWLMRQSVQQRVVMNEVKHATAAVTSYIKDDLGGVTREAQQTIAEVRPRLTAQLESTTALTDELKILVLTAEKGVATTFDDLHKEMERIAATHGKIDVVFSQEVLEKFRDTGLDALVEVKGVLGDANATGDSVKNVARHYEGKLVPKPKEYSKNPVKRFFQKTGMVTWRVVKAGAGSALLLLDVYTTVKGL